MSVFPSEEKERQPNVACRTTHLESRCGRGEAQPQAYAI
jgi:hypothetical protein